MDQLLETLRSIVGDADVLSDADELLVYECDGLTQHKHPPRAVVFPASTEEVSAVVRELARAHVPFVPRGAGTGLSGGALAVGRGVVIELARMRRLLKIDSENRLAIVETGMVNAHVSRAVASYGLHYVPDPSSGTTCTVGGNIAENAGGIHCLKYGTTTDHILAARVVLSEGSVVELGSGTLAESAGYDLLGVFVGSEGTFGIATEATVRLIPLPQAVRTLLADFADVDDASRAVSALIAAGLIPAALEMVDGETIRAVEASVFAAGLPQDAGAALLIELDGLEEGLDEEVTRAEAVCRGHAARSVRRAADEAERKRLWAARKGAFGAMGRLAPDMMLQDAVVPRSRLPEVLAATYRIGARHRLRLANVFHAGDGNLHPIICFDRRNREELRRVEAANREIVETCVRAGGTLTGEHGIGLDKSAYMPLIFSADDLEVMLAVRAAFDPTRLLNPGKVIPAPRGCGEARAIASAKRASDEEADAGPRTDDCARSRGGASKLDEDARCDENVSGQGGDAQQGFAASGEPRSLQTPLVNPAALGDAHAAAPSRGWTEFRFPASRLPRELESIVGANHVASQPNGLVVAPASEAEACEIFRLAGRADAPVVPAGAGLWTEAQGGPQNFGLIVSTRRMSRILAHEPADLVATVEAGVTLENLNAELARSRQWLPLDPPDNGHATVGGIVATGLGGAQSFAYGLPRAFVLGMRVVLADGRAIKAGGRVVKNVAGYDLCKLFSGSLGTLGLITELTFKLRPRPAREATLVARAADAGKLCEGARRLRAGRFLPVALELLTPLAAQRVGLAETDAGFALLVRFAGNLRPVESQLECARDLFTESGATHIELFEDDARLWRVLASEPLRSERQLQWRAALQPSSAAQLLVRLAQSDDKERALVAHASLGCGRVRVYHDTKGDPRACARQLAEVRAQLSGVRAPLVVERASEEVRGALAALGVPTRALPGGQARLMSAIKRQLDPRELLSPEGDLSREHTLAE